MSSAGLHHSCGLQVGEACVGKTTLANNLFAAYCREGDADMSDGPHTVQEFTEDPEAGCTDIEIQVQPEESEPKTSFHYYIQVCYRLFPALLIWPGLCLLASRLQCSHVAGYEMKVIQNGLSMPCWASVTSCTRCMKLPLVCIAPLTCSWYGKASRNCCPTPPRPLTFG